MSDLISRSALLDAMNYNRKINSDENGVLAIEISSLIDYVEKMPTAYDVDKVVAELEGMKDDCGFIRATPEANSYCKAINKAIDIVKRGGRDE